MNLHTFLKVISQKFLSEETKERSERVFLWIALVSFIVHLLIISLIHLNILPSNNVPSLLKNPIAAIYTPFSFILVYEVYLLIYYLPKSTSTYILKQYEIIALVIIRRLFKDLSELSISSDWFSNKYDLQFTYDLIASVILFYLIYLFKVQSNRIFGSEIKTKSNPSSISKFITAKKWMAICLVPILAVMSIYSFLSWSIGIMQSDENSIIQFKNINNIFFEHFFSLLIIADVVLLLFSFFHTDEFHKVIRNSGFIISTILIRISFSVAGILNNILIVFAVLFGLSLVYIHNKFEKNKAEAIKENTEGEKISS